MKFLFVFIFFSLGCAIKSQVICDPGYYDAGAKGCKKCPLGTFQPDKGRSGCKPCPDGQVSMVEGSTECVPCGTNEEPSQFKHLCNCITGAVPDRKGNCKLCKPGEYMYLSPNGRRRSCSTCDSDEFQPEAGQTECIPCPDNQRSNEDRTKCIKCPEGEVLIDGKCGKCPPGQRYDGYGCTECDMGTFKVAAGQSPCHPCPRGSFSMYGAKKCTRCPDGKALMSNGKCRSCPPGRHYYSYGFSCAKCSPNEFMPYENIRERCFDCSEDTNAKSGATMCTKCPLGEVLMKDGTCGVCPPGSEYDTYSLKCRRCDANRYSKGSGRDQRCEDCPDLLYARRGAEKCFPCPSGTALVIKKGRGRCTACSPGSYYQRYSAECLDCGENAVSPGGIEDDCTNCDDGMVPNAERTECV